MTVLRVVTRLDRLSVMSAMILSVFLMVSAGVDFCNHHEADEESHDLCPACQWNNLHQDNYSGAGEICNIISSITLINTRAASPALIIPSDIDRKVILSRGPPSSI